VLAEGDEKLQQKIYQEHWQAIESLSRLAKEPVFMAMQGRWLKLGEVDSQHGELMHRALMALKPWRKGPMLWHGLELEAEWDSDLKWRRLEPHLDNLWGKNVLDVGCNNGYYLLRTMQQDPAYALGIDPTPRFYLQWLLLTLGLPLPRTDFQLLGIEHLGYFPKRFDCILCMGIIYHHPDPIGQLQLLKEALRAGGQLILEGMGIDHPESISLFPESRYAKAPGVWFLPSLSCMINWVKRAGFRDVKVIDSRATTAEEQRNTIYCPRPFESLGDFLNPEDAMQTVEGYPAPWRHMLCARA